VKVASHHKASFSMHPPGNQLRHRAKPILGGDVSNILHQLDDALACAAFTAEQFGLSEGNARRVGKTALGNPAPRLGGGGLHMDIAKRWSLITAGLLVLVGGMARQAPKEQIVFMMPLAGRRHGSDSLRPLNALWRAAFFSRASRHF
jgi:hypothetical protein